MESTQSLHREASQSTLSVHVEPKHEPVSTATPLLDLNETALVPQGWPTSPSRINRPLSTILLNGAFDIASFALSACFLVFSLVVISYDGEPTSENLIAASVLTRATRYGPTIFPLLFASVVGRATHAILLWRLEKGERIQILDTLATSTSLTSTVTSQINLRQISVLSILLVAIWALSPIGGQASLRQMSIKTVAKHSDSSFRYVVPNNPLGVMPYGSGLTSLFTTAMYYALTTETSPIDLWGNVKIPRIEHYEKKAKPDSNGWFETNSNGDPSATYSSFIGISIDGAKNSTSTTDYDFHLQAEYLQLTCAFVNYTMELTSDAFNATGGHNVIWWSINDTANRSDTALETLEPFNFSYREPDWSHGDISCSVEDSYVEVGVLCTVNSTCRATKVRRSQLPQLPPALTFMDVEYTRNTFISYFMLSIGGGRGEVRGNSILTTYLSRSTSSIVAETQWKRVSDEVLSDRFGQLFNSYWICTNSYRAMITGIDADNSFFWDTNITFKPPKRVFDDPYTASNLNWTYEPYRGTKRTRVWSSTGNKYEHIEVIVAHKPWAVTLAIASFVLIIFSLIPPLVRHFLTRGPDIAMNFSSLATRNNTHVPIPAGGSFLPASDRFRLLRDLRLRFADAEGKSDVGNLVIAAQGIEKAEYSRVHKGRLYE
ncbi:hypothetical protein IG631_21402 [Alternaria alternata]|nr:hypothetical protein IG631_21402 [Alternaria alternata]